MSPFGRGLLRGVLWRLQYLLQGSFAPLQAMLLKNRNMRVVAMKKRSDQVRDFNVALVEDSLDWPSCKHSAVVDEWGLWYPESVFSNK